MLAGDPAGAVRFLDGTSLAISLDALAGTGAAAMVVLPWLTPRFFRAFGVRPSELEAKFLLLALFGLTHKIITQTQYSIIIATAIGSAVVPTLVANAFFIPRYLLPQPSQELPGSAEAEVDGGGES